MVGEVAPLAERLDLKPLLKGLKGDLSLCLALFDTGITDAQYLAGLVAAGRLGVKKKQMKC